jgi:hypothetical protein
MVRGGGDGLKFAAFRCPTQATHTTPITTTQTTRTTYVDLSDMGHNKSDSSLHIGNSCSNNDHSFARMENNHRNSEGSNCSHDTAAIEGGDLSRWDYLTRNFDHDDIFQERDTIMSTVVFTDSKPSNSFGFNTIVPNKLELQQPYSSGSSLSHENIHTTTVPGLGLDSNFIAANTVVINSGHGGGAARMFLPLQNISYELPDQSAITLTLEPIALSTFPFDPLSQLDIKSFREATHTHDLTTPLDFALDTAMTNNNNDMSLIDLEPIPPRHSSATAAVAIVSAMNSQSDFGNSTMLSDTTTTTTTGHTLARAASCRWESTTLTNWRGDDGDGGSHRLMATSYSFPTLTTSQKKRLCPDSFETNCGSWNYTPEVCNDTLSDIVPYPSSPATTTLTPPPPPLSTTTDSHKRLKFCKPLKVYNYFYRDERDNIVHGMKQHGDPLPPPVSDFSQAKFEQLLHQRWYVLDMRHTVYIFSYRRVLRNKHTYTPLVCSGMSIPSRNGGCIAKCMERSSFQREFYICIQTGS